MRIDELRHFGQESMPGNLNIANRGVNMKTHIKLQKLKYKIVSKLCVGDFSGEKNRLNLTSALQSEKKSRRYMYVE